MRFLFITHTFRSRYEQEICRALLATGQFDVQHISAANPAEATADLRKIAHLFASYRAVISFIKFRLLQAMEPIPWRGYAGRRVMYDADAVNSFSVIATPTYLGAYPVTFERHGYDEFVSTGKLTAQLLNNAGVPARWLPKAFDSSQLPDQMNATRRHEMVHIGSPYPARRATLSALKRAGVPARDEKCRYEDLYSVLGQYSTGLVCNMEAVRRHDLIPWRLALTLPHHLVTLRPGLEPMAKNFEVAAAGCAPVMDYMEELEALGFVDDVNCIFYQSPEELVQRIRDLEIDEARRVGRAASQLCIHRHSWQVRARQMIALLESADGTTPAY